MHKKLRQEIIVSNYIWERIAFRKSNIEKHEEIRYIKSLIFYLTIYIAYHVLSDARKRVFFTTILNQKNLHEVSLSYSYQNNIWLLKKSYDVIRQALIDSGYMDVITQLLNQLGYENNEL